LCAWLQIDLAQSTSQTLPFENLKQVNGPNHDSSSEAAARPAAAAASAAMKVALLYIHMEVLVHILSSSCGLYLPMGAPHVGAMY
jgi:hypothetical protein